MKKLLAGVLMVLGMAFVFQGATLAAEKAERVGGTYRVKSIEKKSANEFVITFESKEKSGRFDELVLVSDHVHMNVEPGHELRLSAEVLKEQGAKAEVSQVLLFLPAGNTHVPVWMLSKHYPDRDLRGSRYIEMHAPTSDYVVL